jgi:uncharacterized protein (TIGR02145 family)
MRKAGMNVSAVLMTAMVATSSGGSGPKEVTIGKQVWMTENLNVDKFRNGHPIPQAKTDAEWKEAGKNKQPAWCYYDNDPTNGAKYGKLYNWFAVHDSRGLAPQGYHIPKESEWTKLTDYLGGEEVAGGKMKSITGWNSPNTGASNTCGFSGLPGGLRKHDGRFEDVGKEGGWWSITETDPNLAGPRFLNYKYGNVYRSGYYNMGDALSVRCLRD